MEGEIYLIKNGFRVISYKLSYVNVKLS